MERVTKEQYQKTDIFETGLNGSNEEVSESNGVVEVFTEENTVSDF